MGTFLDFQRLNYRKEGKYMKSCEEIEILMNLYLDDMIPGEIREIKKAIEL